jgi:hypothetical protein
VLPTSHWTYQQFEHSSDLEQGDILEPTEELNELFKEIHPYFCDSKFLGFMILTQSCDLVRRKGSHCKAQYISLAVIRSLEEALPVLLNSACRSVGNGIYEKETKEEAKKLLSRVFNQNEQALGVFYLHPDEQAGIAVPSISLLRVSVAFRSTHYKILMNARRGRLSKEFVSKLGWLTGNLFSRVGTPDWDKKKLDKLINLFLESNPYETSDNLPIWLSKSLITEAEKNGVNVKGIERNKVISTLEQYAPPTPKEEILKIVIDIIGEVVPNIDEPQLNKINNRLNNSGLLKSALKRASSQ